MSGKSKNKKRMKKSKSKSRGIAIAFLLLALLFAIGFLGYKTLRVAHIEIEGNEFITKEEIIKLSKIEIGEHMLKLNCDAIKAAVSKQPFLDVLSVTRKYPNTVLIKVRERKKDAVIQYMEQAIFIDRSGRVLEIRSGVNIEDMLVVKGMSVSGFSMGEPISVHDEYQLAVLVKVLNALYDSKQDGWYTAIDMTNPIDIRLEALNTIKVDIGQASDIERQLDTANKALNACNERGMTGGVLDLNDSYTAAYSPPEPTPIPTATPTSDEENQNNVTPKPN